MSRDASYPLRVAADKYADRIALVHGDARWSFRDVDRDTDLLASGFVREGFTGTRVVLLLNNDPVTIMVSLALARAGAITVPVNPRLLLDEVAFIVDDSGAGAIVADVEFVEAARALRSRCAGVDRVLTVHRPEDGAPDLGRVEDFLVGGGDAASVEIDPHATATIIYTSGTSGFPKGVARSHDANLWACVNSALGQPRTPEDIEVFVLPLFGVAFVFQVLPMILAGGTVVLDGSFDAQRTWKLLERHRATRIFVAPTMISSMLDVEGHEGYDVSALRVVNTAYEFPERVRTRAAARFGDVLAYQYGLTEAQLCCSTPEEFAADPTNAGNPMGMMRIRAVDDDRQPVPSGTVGEIAFSGPSLMTGYDGRPDVTAEVLEDGWLYTGDLGYLDAHGRVHITGRKKEMIKTGGFSVDPVEVEQTILAFPGVREAAVVGVPDEHWGERVVAFVAGTGGGDDDARELISFARSRMAGYKCPKRIAFVEELPKNAMGKIERGRLRKQAAEAAANA